MCESNAYILINGIEEPLFEGVDRLEGHDGQIKMVNLYGEEKIITARIKVFSLIDHKIVLEPL